MTAKAPPVSLRPFRFTREQYYQLADLGYFAGKRVERIRGEILEMSPINWPHVVGCRKTAELLERAFAGIAWVSRNEQPLALADSDPQPDVMVVAGRFEDYSDHPTTAILVVEVADSTLARDTTTKAELYASASIAEYWVLDVTNRELHVYRDPQALPNELNAFAYQSHRVFTAAESVSPLAVPIATLAVSELLP